MLNKLHRPFCQHVLPLTYDDSMSYYEVLCQVIRRLNQFSSDAEDYIQEILREMGLDDAVRFRCVYNVKDYGAKGDGATDDRLAIQEALNVAHDAGGGIVYIPDGHYLTSKCIIIGDNCTLAGSGAGTVLELTDMNPFWGVCVGIVGSNCGCMNMKILYAEQAGVEAPIVNGPAWGALGITNCDYYTAVDQRRGGSLTASSNIMVSDIYTEGFYALQVEPALKISNVLYKNIYAPGGMVSIQGGSRIDSQHPYGHVNNVIVDNCVCDFLRILGATYSNGIYVYGLKTHYIYTNGNDVHFDGFICDCSGDSPFDGAGYPIEGRVAQFFNAVPTADPGIPIVRSSAAHGTIIGKGTATTQNGLCLVPASKYIFENINSHGCSLRNITGAAESDTIFIGCDAAETGITNSPTGTGIANNMGAAFTETSDYWTSVYTDVSGTITWAEGYSATVASSYINKNGNLIYGNITAYKAEGSVALEDLICTLPFKPAQDVYFTGFMMDISQDNSIFCPAIFKVNTNGQVTLFWNSRHTPSSYNGLMFTFTYSLIHHAT